MSNDKSGKPGLIRRVTGFFSSLLGSAPEPKAPVRRPGPSRPSGASPAVPAPRTAPARGAAPTAAKPAQPAAPPRSTSHLSEVEFASFDLPEPVRRGIADAGFVRCTPIQEKVLPLALGGEDVAGQAQTGTGKTAAFLVSTFTRLLRSTQPRVEGSPRAFVIAPTRELVAQIENDAKMLGAHTGLKIHAVYGGVDYGRQREILRGGVDLLIGTPGRLIDYYKQKVYNLDGVEVLVIDEADRMFDMGFLPDLRYMLRKLPPFDRRQSMLFSATLSYRVMELAYEHMNLPQKVEVAPEQKTAEKVTQLLYHVGGKEKFNLLLGLLRRDGGERILIFVNTKVGAESIVRRLEANGFRSAELSGDIPQPKRIKVLAEFKDGSLPILVATDVAARGLHIDGVTHVYNYDIPLDPEDYVHRIGRTARAGASGHAVSLACERYVSGLPGIEAYIGAKIPVQWADDALFVPDKKPERGSDRRDGRGEHHGSPRGERGGGGAAGARGRGGRPDRIDRVVRHHPTKEAALEAQLEAEGVEFEDAPPPGSRRPTAAPASGERPAGDRPAGEGRRRRRRGGRGRSDGETRPAPEAGGVARESETVFDSETGRAVPSEYRFDDGTTPPAPLREPRSDSPVSDGGPSGAPRKRRRRRGGRGRGAATAGASDSGNEAPADGGGGDDRPVAAPGSFWNPDGA